MSELSVKHLLGIKYLTEKDIHLIFETAAQFKEVINRPIKKVPSLRDITIPIGTPKSTQRVAHTKMIDNVCIAKE